MNTKEFEVIEVSKGLSVVVDKAIQPVTGNYYDTFISAVMNTGGAEYEKSRHTLQIIATIGQKLEGVPRVVAKDEVWGVAKFADYFVDKAEYLSCNVGMGAKWNRHELNREIIQVLADVAKKAQEKAAQSKGVYSEEQMKLAMLFALALGNGLTTEQFHSEEIKNKCHDFISSLNHPKQIKSVVLEMELHPVNHASGLEPTGDPIMDVSILQNYKPKLTTPYEIVPVEVRY